MADTPDGAATHSREHILSIGKDFAVGIQGDAKVWLLDNLGQRDGDSVKPAELGVALGPKAFRRVTCRAGTRGRVSSRFCFRRVKVAGSGKKKDAEQPPLWLVIEWPEGERKPKKFFLTSLVARLSRKEIVRIIKERWHTERVYSELKGELGLDHFEGRFFPAWHHHITVVLCCHAFLVAERSRRFPPPRTCPPKVTRTNENPARHYEDSLASHRRILGRVLVRWLPRCPTCGRAHKTSAASCDGGSLREKSRQ